MTSFMNSPLQSSHDEQDDDDYNEDDDEYDEDRQDDDDIDEDHVNMTRKIIILCHFLKSLPPLFRNYRVTFTNMTNVCFNAYYI